MNNLGIKSMLIPVVVDEINVCDAANNSSVGFSSQQQ
jgi:hypothetical protein